MVGIDITTVTRFQNKSEAFIKRILHPIEVAEFNSCTNQALFLASRWAIKEALYKADNTLSTFNEILIEKIEKRYVFKGFNISTSYEGNKLVAIAIKDGE